jgi:CMP-N-acetylneuraminic acid synthetase
LNQRIISTNGLVEFLFEKKRKKQLRRQDKQEVFVHGNMFSFKTNEFFKQKTLTPKPMYSVKLKNYFESIDIDDLEDYKKALIYSKKIT